MTGEQGQYSGLDLLSTGVLIIDLQGKPVYVNTAAESMFGRSQRMLREASILVMIDGVRGWVRAYAANPSPSFTVQNELSELHRPPKSPLQVYVSVNTIPDEPERLILEILPAQATLQQNRERHINEMSENTRRLLRNLAHEIKNPLGGIRGAAQLLQADLDDPDQKECTAVVISEADRLQQLVDKILTPYRQPYQPIPLNVHEILERVRLLIEAEFAEGLVIVRDYDSSAPEITGDRGQLTQVFLNLMRNAAEALSERMASKDGMITLKTRVLHHVFIGSIRHRAALNVHVIDNGAGVPPNLKDSIFYPMVSSKSNGTGLGLSLVQTFVEQHGGSIEVKSEKGNTDFSLLFPLYLNRDAVPKFRTLQQ